MKKLIALAGSFNPVTVAHRQILSDAVEKYGADEGIFITTNDKYLTKKCLTKSKEPTNFILPAELRGRMISSLSSENPKLSYWGSELGGASPNTYKTLCQLKKDKAGQYPGEEIKLYFLFGADKLRKAPEWKHAEETIALCEYIVCARKFDMDKILASDPFFAAHRGRIHLMQLDDSALEDVSSTEVRRRFFAGEDYRLLMDDAPYQFMQDLNPVDFHPVTTEDSIKNDILYGGRYGMQRARMKVFKDNCRLFKAWSEPWLGDREEHRKAIPYMKPFTVNVPKLSEPTVTGCENADCVDVAKALIDEGFNPAIHNLASLTSPGGGYHKGAGAQEESLCQASTLSQSLYQFGDPKYKHIRESGIKTVPGVYPMDVNYGGIYSPCVTFFRHNSGKYYAMREETFDCPVVSVASLSNRDANEYNASDEHVYFDADGCLTDLGRAIELNKIRTVFRIALSNGNDSMVLGAFGCGVFNLHPDEVASLFRDVLQEPEFINRFKKLVFAIYEGKPTSRKPSGPNGKYAPFYKLFA